MWLIPWMVSINIYIWRILWMVSLYVGISSVININEVSQNWLQLPLITDSASTRELHVIPSHFRHKFLCCQNDITNDLLILCGILETSFTSDGFCGFPIAWMPLTLSVSVAVSVIAGLMWSNIHHSPNFYVWCQLMSAHAKHVGSFSALRKNARFKSIWNQSNFFIIHFWARLTHLKPSHHVVWRNTIKKIFKNLSHPHPTAPWKVKVLFFKLPLNIWLKEMLCFNTCVLPSETGLQYLAVETLDGKTILPTFGLSLLVLCMHDVYCFFVISVVLADVKLNSMFRSLV